MLDGAYYPAIADGFAKVTKAEEFYTSWKKLTGVKITPKNAVSLTLPGGKLISSPDFSASLRFTVHELNGKQLITLLFT
ncbi:MAG: hypothetical protein Q4G59_10560 [Planctomycetia bacterium]|nr:hypothetical protein [Planctomycetia bacterium]